MFSEIESDVLRQIPNVHFSPYSLGIASLPRTALVSQIRAVLDRQMKETMYGPYNVYCYGMKASGKTLLLTALAKQLQDEDYIVYFFKDARLLDTVPLIDEELPTTHKVAVIVDEVQSGSTAGAWTLLLKNTHHKLVVIGAGPVQFDILAPTSHFRERISVNLISKVEEDDTTFKEFMRSWQERLGSTRSQLQELIDYWKSAGTNTTDQTIEDICNYLCDICGGHFFATAKFTEHAFTCCGKDDDYNKNLTEFKKHFNSLVFRQSKSYKDVYGRCLLLDDKTQGALERVLVGCATCKELGRLEKFGLYSNATNDIVSPLLINEVYQTVQKTSDAILLRKENGPQHNLELLIVEGLNNMTSDAFQCIRDASKFPIENSLSFAWSLKVVEHVSNVYIQSQSRATSGHVDFYCNGFINGAIEVLHNASPSSTGQNMEEHVSRFRESKYDFENWAILHFVTKKSKKLILPAMESLHDRIYTYDHEANALYQGRVIIKQPAIMSFPSAKRVEYRPFCERLHLTKTDSEAMNGDHYEEHYGEEDNKEVEEVEATAAPSSSAPSASFDHSILQEEDQQAAEEGSIPIQQQLKQSKKRKQVEAYVAKNARDQSNRQKTKKQKQMKKIKGQGLYGSSLDEEVVV